MDQIQALPFPDQWCGQPESDQGSVEYKYHLCNATELKYKKRLSQMRYRLQQPVTGQATYIIGIMDDGCPLGVDYQTLQQSLQILQSMAHQLEATVQYQIYTSPLQQVPDRLQWSGEGPRYLALASIHSERCTPHLSVTEANRQITQHRRPIRIAVVGGVDSGKSTTIGVLSHGLIDNGRGLARSRVFNYQHEQQTGHTSSIAHHIVAFDSQGQIIKVGNKQDWPRVMARAHKSLSLLDLAGHRKYIHTTIRGLSGLAPDYVLITIGANMGLNPMTKEHLIVAMAYRIPIIIAITKVDIAPPAIYQKSKNQLARLIKRLNPRLQLIYPQDNLTAVPEHHIPVYILNNTDPQDPGRACLTHLLFNLPARWKAPSDRTNLLYTVHEYFQVHGIGRVVNGVLLRGTLSAGQKVWLGPFQGRHLFIPVTIRSIHQHRVTRPELGPSNHGCLALKTHITYRHLLDNITPGMIIVNQPLEPGQLCQTFQATLRLTKITSTYISVGYQPVVHIGNLCQTIQIIDLQTQPHKRTMQVTCQLTQGPAYLESGTALIIREGDVRAIGTVTKTIPWQK